MIDSRYSVSPFVHLISGGPNPSENLSTRTPRHLATRKCPSSWTKITSPSRSKPGRTRDQITGNSLWTKAIGRLRPAVRQRQAWRDQRPDTGIRVLAATPIETQKGSFRAAKKSRRLKRSIDVKLLG